MYQNAQATLSPAPVFVPTIPEAIDRVQSFVSRIMALTADLGAHADRLHGGTPESATGAAAQPLRTGAIGALQDVFDELDSAIVRLTEQVQRNIILA